MAYRSWLQDVKWIEDLGPTGFGIRSEDEDCFEREIHYCDKLRDVQKQLGPHPSGLKGFFGLAMNDSHLISVTRDKGTVELVVNEIYANDFAFHLAKQLEQPTPKFNFPVRFHALDVVYCKSVHVTLDGGLAWQSLDDLNYLDEEVHLRRADWKVDRTYAESGRLQWVIEFHLANWPQTGRGTSGGFLMIDCKHVKVFDERHRAIANQFGEPWAEVWDEVFKIIATDQPQPNWLVMEELELFIVEEGKKRGLLED